MTRKASSAAMSAWIDFEPGHEAPQAQSQYGPQSYGINCASIDSADEKVSETYGCQRRCSAGCRSAKIGKRYATAHSLRQQGGRPEAWRPLRLVHPVLKRQPVYVYRAQRPLSRVLNSFIAVLSNELEKGAVGPTVKRSTAGAKT